MRSIFMLIIASAVLVIALNQTMIGRGAVPPPPLVGGNGGIGDWLPGGPLFGFDDPWGPGFGGHSGGTGDPGNPGGLGGSGGSHPFGHEWQDTSHHEPPINLCCEQIRVPGGMEPPCTPKCCCCVEWYSEAKPETGTLVEGRCEYITLPLSIPFAGCSQLNVACITVMRF
ncbi:MAG TPA: hypothetical protein VHI13_01470 [Candidatus Kapabacteria bacterium]|nr:hypothetical protein [Candidatus Kapabacteria bacterium]